MAVDCRCLLLTASSPSRADDSSPYQESQSPSAYPSEESFSPSLLSSTPTLARGETVRQGRNGDRSAQSHGLL